MGEIFLTQYKMISFAWCDLSHPNTPVEKKEQANFAEMDPSLGDKLTNTIAGYTNLLLTQERN